MTIFLFSCSDKTYLKKINSYLNAATSEAKAAYMSENYRSFFMEKKGEGDDKTTSLNDFKAWDGQMAPDVTIFDHSSKGKTWLVHFNEQNDFSKLIGFPGWKASMSVTFDNTGLITETIYFPDSTNPDYKKWLQPAVDWLNTNFADELNEVYQNNRLIKNEAAAIKWKELLTRWNTANKN